MVKARPILMSGPMVRACLKGTKTMTRRTIKEARDIGARCTDEVRSFGDGSYYICAHDGTHMIGEFRCPYGQPGDLLWVRETWGTATRPCPFQGWRDGIELRADANCDASILPLYEAEPPEGVEMPAHTGRWRPSIHMPRWASRLTLRVTDVRVQRLQDISEADAEAEGVWSVFDQDAARTPGTALGCFPHLWDSINGKRAPWDSNPWVWAVRFDPIRANVDTVLEKAS